MSVLAPHLNISFVDSIRLVGRLQVGTAALLQFRSVDLNPAPDAGSVDGKTTLRHDRRHVPIAERKAQVPPHTKKDNLAFVMSPKERIGPRDRHRFTLPLRFGFFATQPKDDAIEALKARIQRQKAQERKFSV